jgi:hypothetical protein
LVSASETAQRRRERRKHLLVRLRRQCALSLAPLGSHCVLLACCLVRSLSSSPSPSSLSAHFKPLWAKNVPHFGIAHALAMGLGPWLAAEVPHLLDTGMLKDHKKK